MNYNHVKDYIVDAYKRLLIPTPAVKFLDFKNLNRCLGGLRPREYTILCGSTGSGKTSIVSALSVDLVKQNIPIYVASVETGPLDFINRMISCIAKQNWNLGEPIPANDIQKFKMQNPWFENIPLYLARYEDRVPNQELLGDIKKAVQDHGVKIAFLDNLNFFMEVTRAQDSIVEMDRVIHDAIIFCKQIDVHLVVVMHPRKTVNGRVESEYDIKGSSTAVQEAHNVLLWNRLEKERIEQNESYYSNFRELKIAKCRRIGKYVGSSIPIYSPNGVSFEERPYES